jgi:antitoxin component HigA of HigAB toxin-antitoxin module
MIQDQASFEAALQRVADLLEHPPAHGTPEDEKFAELLHDIESYQPPVVMAPPETPLERIGHEADDLVAKAADFLNQRRERAEREKLMSFPEDGQGIGPTTGV